MPPAGLCEFIPDGDRTPVPDSGVHLMNLWMDMNQVSELTGVIVIAGLFITGLSMIGIMLGSPASSH